MTANDVLRQAYMLLNYTDNNGNINAANNANLSKRALPVINQIYADLWQPRIPGLDFCPLHSANQPLDLDDYVAMNIMPYGVAMMLAQSDGDTDNQTVYAQIYNQKRGGAVVHTDRIQDVFPRPLM